MHIAFHSLVFPGPLKINYPRGDLRTIFPGLQILCVLYLSTFVVYPVITFTPSSLREQIATSFK